jgi:hypothetical protein
MPERSVYVTLKADVAAYLEAMGFATEATDKLAQSIKNLREEKRKLAEQG